jgi:hypothetical protein
MAYFQINLGEFWKAIWYILLPFATVFIVIWYIFPFWCVVAGNPAEGSF